MFGRVVPLSELSPPPPSFAPKLPGDDKTLDLEKLLPLELIRIHTKTDDTPSVSDEQLMLYREAAFEACELYTGRKWTKSETIITNADTPGHKSKFRRVTTMYLDYPTIDGLLMFYGGGLIQPQHVRVAPGSIKVKVPVFQEALDASSCCRPGGMGAENFGVQMMYRTGLADESKMPSGIKLGCLKFIAWAVVNPGDVIMTVRNTTSTGDGSLQGTNNGAWASGAIEQWRLYSKSAI